MGKRSGGLDLNLPIGGLDEKPCWCITPCLAGTP